MAPPVYKPGSGRVTINPKSAQRLAAGARAGLPTIQRNCGTPGCTDPLCLDPANHGFGGVRPLRGRTVYYGDVTPGDIGTGTGTSTGTRAYVNSPSTTYPREVAITYSTPTVSGHSEFINQPLAPGRRADAGHIFGRQYGGYGDDNAAVFPQNPQINRGNYLGGAPTRSLWREHEDTIRHRAQAGETVTTRVTLRDAPRPDYSRRACRFCAVFLPTPVPSACPSCHQTNP